MEQDPRPQQRPSLRASPPTGTPAPKGVPLTARAPHGRPVMPRAADLTGRATAKDSLPRRLWDAKTSIAVIGAGIGGLTAAMRLKALGYTNVAVFERDSVVGGKCQGMEVGGLWFDLGGQLLFRGSNPTIFQLAAELGAEWQPLGDGIFRAVDLEGGGTVRPFKGTLCQSVKVQQAVEPFQKAAALASGSSSWLAPHMGAPAASQTITQLLNSQGVSPEEVEQFLLGYTASGYGYPGDTPAPYFFRFLQDSTGPMQRLKAGYQDLLERMAAHVGRVTCRKGVQEVVRSAGEGVKVVFESGEERTFDKAIVTGSAWMGAAPPQGCISWTPAEAALIATPWPRLFYTTLATVTGWGHRFPVGIYFIERHCTDRATVGHCVAFQRFHVNSDVFLFWSYATAPADDVSRLLRADVAAMKGVITEVHEQRMWRYCYQLPTEDIAAGDWVRRFDDEIQGKGSVFYIGGAITFESTECTAVAAEELVTKHFARPAERPLPASQRLPTAERSCSLERPDCADGESLAEPSGLGSGLGAKLTPVPLFPPVEEAELAFRAEIAARRPTMLPTVDHLLRRQVGVRPDKIAYVQLDAKCQVAATLTFAQLNRAADQVAGRLASRGVARGDRVLLMFPPDRPLNFIQAFFGCVRGGYIPVPLAPVDLGGSRSRVEDGQAKLALIARDCGAGLLLTTAKVLLAKRAQAVGRLWKKRKESEVQLEWVATDKWAPIPAWNRDERALDAVIQASEEEAPGDAASVLGGPSPDSSSPALTIVSQGVPGANGHSMEQAKEKKGASASDPLADDAARGVCFLMYTSGSTGDPKGVMVGHANLMHNLGLQSTVWSAGTRSVSWLPLWHDMGLIAAALCHLVSGGSVFLLSPLAFIQNPVLWMQACSQFRATATHTPAFALDLVVRKHKPGGPALDLSPLRLVNCGAEPICPQTLERFAATFAPAGLKPSAIMCGYGLAEHVVYVSHQWGAPCFIDGGRVSCGLVQPPQHDTVEVRIVEPATCLEAAEGEEGEIWIRSPSACLGYWNRPDETEKVFGGRLYGSQDGGRFLKTGDLGRIVDGRLFVTGRIKDMIVVRGHNVYPQDIERAVQDTEERFLRPGGVVAVQAPTPPGQPEGVLLIAELRDVAQCPAELPGRISAAVEGTAGVAVAGVYILPPKTLSKTTSGKVRRNEMLRRWATGELDTLAKAKSFSSTDRSWVNGPKAEQGIELVSTQEGPPRKPGASAVGTDAAERIQETAHRLYDLSGLKESGVPFDGAKLLVEAGMDSLAIAELVGRIEEELGPRLALDELGFDRGSLSLDDLAAQVLSAMEGDQPPGGASLGTAAEPDPSTPEVATGDDKPGDFALERVVSAPLVSETKRLEVQEIIAGLVEVPIGGAAWHTPLVELGFDSLKAADALQALNEQFGFELDFETSGLVEGGTTPGTLAETVMAALGAATEPASLDAPALSANPLHQETGSAAATGSRALMPYSRAAQEADGAAAAGLPSVEFRQGQLAMIRMLPTAEMRLAAARVASLEAVKAYFFVEPTASHDGKPLEAILLESIGAEKAVPEASSYHRGNQDPPAYAAPSANGKARGDEPVDKPLPGWIRLPVILLLASVVPVLGLAVPGIPVAFIVKQTFATHFHATPRGLSLVALRDAALLVAAYIAYVLCLSLWAVLFKWLIIGRYKPGRYSLWGCYHIRWWCVYTTFWMARIFTLTMPAWQQFLVYLGGARIGKGVSGVTLEAVPETDLVSVGEGSRFEGRVKLRVATFEPGVLILQPVTVGARCTVGTNAVLGGGCELLDGAHVAPFQAVEAGTVVHGQAAPGLSPAQRETGHGAAAAGASPDHVSIPVQAGSRYRVHPVVIAYRRAAYLALLITSAVVCLQPCIEVIHVVSGRFPGLHPVLQGILLLGLYYAFMTLMIVANVATKWLLLGKVKPRVFHSSGWYATRRYLVNEFITFTTGSLVYQHLTLTYLSPWLMRAYGARLGWKALVSTAICPSADADLLTVGEGSVCGGGCVFHLETAQQNGPLKELRPITIGRRCVVGTKSHVGAGTVLENGASVGLLTYVPDGTRVPTQHVIRGPQTKTLARPQPTDLERPLKGFKVWFGVLLDIALLLFMVAGAGAAVGLIVMAFHAAGKLGAPPLLRVAVWVGLSIGLHACIVIAVCATAVVIKWLLLGNQRSYPKLERGDFRNTLVARSLVLTRIFVPALAGGVLNGTPIGNWFLNCLGARISSSAVLHECFIFDHDWVTIGDDAIVDRWATISPHIIWDLERVRYGPIVIGPRCSVAPECVVLPCTFKEGVTLRPLSHPPTDVELRGGTVWEGVPARSVEA